MRLVNDVKIKGIKVNYSNNDKAISVTITIPLDNKKFAYETITPDGEVTKIFIGHCVDKRRDFIRDWNEWKITMLGQFDFRKYFWNSNNREKYIISGGDQLTIKERGRLRMDKIKAEKVKKAKTIRTDQSITNMVDKHFGHLHISELTVKHFQDMVDNSGVTPKAISHRKSQLQALIRVAMTEGVITKNIFHGWEPEHKACNLSTHEKKAYNKEQFNIILNIAQNFTAYYPVFLFISTMGMRPGEVFGLKWKYVNQIEGHIEVQETLNENGWSFTDTPKTKAGHRLVALNNYSRSAIETQRSLTDYTDPEALVFQHANASNKLKAWSGGTFRSVYYKIMAIAKKEHGIDRISSYNIRHSFASILWNSKQIAIEDLQVLLGHADIQTTMNCYVVKDKPTEGVSTSAINTLLDVSLASNPIH